MLIVLGVRSERRDLGPGLIPFDRTPAGGGVLILLVVNERTSAAAAAVYDAGLLALTAVRWLLLFGVRFLPDQHQARRFWLALSRRPTDGGRCAHARRAYGTDHR